MANKREPIIAKKGVFTDGKGFFADVIWAAIGTNPDEFYEIAREEYEAIMNTPEDERATDEDYQNALRELGVKI